MNTKSLAIIAILAAIGVGLYIKINSVPPPVDPEEAAGTYDSIPDINLGGDGAGFDTPGTPTTTPNTLPGSSAPSFQPGSEAPPFQSSGEAPPFQGGGAPPFQAGGSEAPPFSGGEEAPPAPADGDIPDAQPQHEESVPGHDTNETSGSYADHAPHGGQHQTIDPYRATPPASGENLAGPSPAQSPAYTPGYSDPDASRYSDAPAAESNPADNYSQPYNPSSDTIPNYNTPDSSNNYNAPKPSSDVGGANSLESSPGAKIDPNVAPLSGIEQPNLEQQRNEFARNWAEAQQLLDTNQLDAALRLLSVWYGEPSLLPAEQEGLQTLLSQLAGTVIYSSESHIEPVYVAEGNEQMAEIATKYNVPEQLLININGLVSPTLNPGQEIKVLRGPFLAEINVHEQEMVLFLAGRYAGKFSVSLGSDCPVLKQNYVKYYVQEKHLQAPPEAGSLGGAAGQHWIALTQQSDQNAGKLFIHGLTDANAAGSPNPSAGVCLGLDDAKDVYSILSVGSEVIFRQ